MASRGGLFGVYAALAVAGAVLPYAIFLPWLAAHGFDPRLFRLELFATGPASIFAADVLLAAGVFILFVIVEGRRLRMRNLWLPPVAVFTIGLCCALPLFLAMRERALAGA
jgi:Terpene cyclase DEP1